MEPDGSELVSLLIEPVEALLVGHAALDYGGDVRGLAEPLKGSGRRMPLLLQVVRRKAQEQGALWSG